MNPTSQQAEGPLAKTLNPPPTQPNSDRGARHRPRPASEGPKQGQRTPVKAKIPSDEGEHRARGGTRTAFQPLQTLGTPENIRNPSQSGRCTAQSEAQGVHIVHTVFFDRF
jgi:hypothetical protein